MHFHVNPVNAIETIQELSACSVFQNVSVEPSTLPAPVSKPVCELFVCPVSVSEPFDDCFVFPAMVPKTVNAPPVLSVSALPRSRSLPWFPAQSAFLCWSSVRSAPLRWPSAQVWWPSAPPWGSSAQVRWSSALPWRTSAPPWWAPVPSAPPWWAPVPSAPPWWAPVPSAPPWWAPGPSAPPWWAPVPSAPPWWAPVLSSPPWWAPVPWGGGGYVTNSVHALPFIHHQRSLAHHIDSCTTRTVAHHLKIQLPSSIGTDVTQLITLITLTPENYHTITITQSHTLYKPWTSSCSLPSIVCAYRYPSR